MKNSAFVSSLVTEQFKNHERVASIFNHDLMPTILDFAGLETKGGNPQSETIQGKSAKPRLTPIARRLFALKPL